MKLTATREFGFDTAHMLTNHEGKCASLHGHRYKLFVTIEKLIGTTVEQPGLPDEGMIADFSEIKSLVDDYLVEVWDHAYVFNKHAAEDSIERQIGQLVSASGLRYVEVPYRVTAENMAMHFLEELNQLLNRSFYTFQVVEVKVYETPKSCATATL